MEGKFFYLKSKTNGQVLRVAEGVHGSHVFVGDKKGDLKELWYQDKINTVLRSRVDENLCLAVPDGKVCINKFHTAEDNQLWKIVGDRIVHIDEEQNKERGQLTIVGDGAEHKSWEVVHIGPTFFHMETCMEIDKKPGEHLVVEVPDGKDAPGTKIQLDLKNADKEKINAPNQLWWEDKYGYIHSKVNDFVMDLKKDIFIINPYADNVESQQWIKAGQVVVNRNKQTQVMDVKGGKNKKGANMVLFEYHGNNNQHWHFQYL